MRVRLRHRATAAARPAEVWSLLGFPGRWPRYDVWLARVRAGWVSDPETGEGPPVAVEAAPGQRLVAVARVSGVPVPVDVLEVDPARRLVVLVHLAPGLRLRVATDLVETPRGQTQVTVTTEPEGPFALPSTGTLWLSSALTTRLLALAAGREARAARRRPAAA